jgi:hypothetical protein
MDSGGMPGYARANLAAPTPQALGTAQIIAEVRLVRYRLANPAVEIPPTIANMMRGNHNLL